MAVNQGKAVRRRSQIQRQAVGTQPSANSQTKTLKTAKGPRKRRRPNTLHFREALGKTVAFIEMDWSAAFPCVEIGFDDKTALLFELGACITIEPIYSDWKTGNQRVMRYWPRRQTEQL